MIRALLPWWGPVALAVYLRAQLSLVNSLEWAGAVAVLAVATLIWRRSLSPTLLMAFMVLIAALIADISSWGGPLRDLHLYLNAGSQFLNHSQVYTVDAISRYPRGGLAFLPYLYAPPTLPLFGLLSLLPSVVSDWLWLAGSTAAVIASLRLFGLSWRWSLAALVWTPIEQGLFVGNIVIPSLLLLALAPRLKGLVVAGPLLKPQNGVMALWLLRERAWRSLAMGILGVLALVAVTLPLTGIGLWRDWIASLLAYQRSEQLLTGLYGVGLGKYLPLWLFAIVAVAVTLLALRARDREGLARLGLASVIASPSLWNHGFIFAIPAFLRLRADVLWLIAGMMCQGQWPGPQAALGLGAISWIVTGLVRKAGDQEFHPFPADREPWPDIAD